MFNQRQRFLIRAVSAIAGIWLAVWAGHWYFARLQVTADKVRAYLEGVNFDALSGAARARALADLEAQLNALSYQERQRLRADRLLRDWFARMTEPEKAEFIEATMPSGFKQMISAFEQLPEDQRRQVIDDAVKHLRAANNRPPAGAGAAKTDTNGPPAISPELEARIRTIGLGSFYSQSSAQTKAEVAPLLEALQREMESGRMILRRQ